jgi:NAD(P)-dependent dehydrogenase (short-subunit alcohol dehydrogenase family)
MFNHAGKTAVVSGGTGAIGLGIAEKLISAGANVFILGRKQPDSNSYSKVINENLNLLQFISCDIANEESVNDAYKQINTLSHKVDILVTCAAAPALSGEFLKTSLKDWRALMSIDLDGVFLSCKVFGESMVANRYGRIVNLTSFHTVATYPYRSVYNAAKSGVEGLSRALAVEWGHYGITVNTVAPGPIKTPRTNWFLSQDKANEAGMLSRTPSVRIGEIEDVAHVVNFLASEEAKHLNGQNIVLDGGWTKNAWWGSHTDLS